MVILRPRKNTHVFGSNQQIQQMKPQQKRYFKDLVVEMWWKNLFEGFLHLSHSQF